MNSAYILFPLLICVGFENGKFKEITFGFWNKTWTISWNVTKTKANETNTTK